MHPVMLEEVAREHVGSLISRADAARLARTALAARSPRPPIRHRVGLRLIALGQRLAPERPQNVAGLDPARGGRA